MGYRLYAELKAGPGETDAELLCNQLIGLITRKQ